MKIAINTPSRRFWNLPILKMSIERAMSTCPAADVLWNIIVTPDQHAQMPAELLAVLDYPWIRVLICSEPPPGYDGCYWKLNSALDELKGFDGYVWFVADDCLIAQSSFQKITATNTGIVVISAARGQHAKFHGCSTLMACPACMTPGQVDGGQLIVHNRFFFQPHLRFESHSGADGAMAVHLLEHYPKSIGYLTGFHYPFNALEPGRWERKELQRILNQ